MRLLVRLFGPQAAAARRTAIPLEIAHEPACCADVRRALAEACPNLTDTLPASRLAVNYALVGDEHPVTDHDEVALIGMVGGG